jgi:hypothetical protein
VFITILIALNILNCDEVVSVMHSPTGMWDAVRQCWATELGDLASTLGVFFLGSFLTVMDVMHDPLLDLDEGKSSAEFTQDFILLRLHRMIGKSLRCEALVY